MGLLKRIAILAGVVEPKTADERRDQIIADAVRSGFEVEYDEKVVRITDLANNSCYCADYSDYPPSLDGARAWMNDRIAARTQSSLQFQEGH